MIEAKPILADCANNIASALDHIVASIAQAKDHTRLRHLYFPRSSTDVAFEKALIKIAPVLGPKMVQVITSARASHFHEAQHVEAAIQISNSGKHWSLMLSAGSAHGVAFDIAGRQRIFQIPADAYALADTFEFYRGTERLPNVPFSIIIRQRIGGLEEGLPDSPDSIFECSFRFVEGVMAAIDDHYRSIPA